MRRTTMQQSSASLEQLNAEEKDKFFSNEEGDVAMEDLQINTGEGQKKQNPYNVLFRCTIMSSRNQSQDKDMLILELIEALNVELIESSAQRELIFTFKKEDILNEIIAFNDSPNSTFSNLQYYDSQTRGWRQIKLQEVKFSSNKIYRQDMVNQEINNGPNNDQGFTEDWIIDIRVKEKIMNDESDSLLLPAIRQADQRIEELEQLVLSIGIQIVEHFQPNNDINMPPRQNQITNDCRGNQESQDGLPEEGCQASTDEDQMDSDTVSDGLIRDQPVASNAKGGDLIKRQNTLEKDKRRDSTTKVSPSTIQSKRSLTRHSQQSFGRLQSNLYASKKQQTQKELMLSNRQTSSVLPHHHSGKLDQQDSFEQLQIANLSMNDKSKSNIEKSLKPSLAHARSNNSTLDLAYIYADPLLLEVQIKGSNRKILVDFNQPLEIDQEFDKISECIRKTKKKFTITKKVATSDNLKSVMGSRPQMIHISCHGDCIQERSGKSTYYLAFEEVERFCVLDQLTEERLRKLLGKNDEHGVKVVFVSACHSEMIGQIFKRVGVPVVIAVNQLTPILDDVCRKFSRHFYEHLVQGNTPKQAFKAGKDAVKGSRNIDVYSCCCAHKHKIWCKWDKHFKQLEKDKQEYDKDLPHNLHMPNSVEQNCKCPKKSNIHKGTCKYYKKFKEAFFPSDFEMQALKLDIFNWEILDNRTMQQTVKVCCCSPEIPHNETQKFMIIKRNFEKEREEAKIKDEEAKKRQANNKGDPAPDNPSDDDEITQAPDVNEESIQQIDNYYLNYRLFNNREEGMLEVQGNMDCYNQLKQMLDTDMLIGRNLVIKDIVQNISEHHRILHVFGSGGMGKSDIVNFAAKYALYGRVELDGAIYVEIDNKETVNALIQSICKRLSEIIILPANQGEYQIEDLIRIIRQYKYLIIMDNLRSLISKNKIEFNKFLQDLLDRTQKPKFIVISDLNDDVTPVKGTSSHISIEKKQSIEIKELAPLHAAQLMMKIANGSQYLKEFKNDVELSRHEIFTKIPLKPTGIVQTAQLIMHQSLDSIVQRKDQEIKLQQEEIERKLKEAVCQAFVNGLQKTASEVQKVDLMVPLNATLLPIQSSVLEEEKNEIEIAIVGPNVANVQNQFDDMSFILKLTFEELMKEYPVESYPYEYQLLFILCLMPSGLFENDIEFLCQMRKNYGDWRCFFGKISQEGKNNKVKSLDEKDGEDGDQKMEQLQEQVSDKEENKKVFKFLQLSFNQDLEQELFVPVPLVRDYILSQLGELPQFKDKVKDYFMLCLKFLAILSRKFLRARAEDVRNEIDHKVITAAIDLGIWHDDYGVNVSNQTSMNTSSFGPTPNFLLDQSIEQRDSRKVHHLELSQVYEANFTTFLDLDMLKQKFQTLSYLQDDASGDIQELCICVVSYLIEWGEYETAQLYLDKCNLIAQHFNLKPLEAKLILLQTSLTYKRKQDPKLEELEELLPKLQIATKVFTENKTFGKFKDALAETLYMQGLILTSICHKQINPLREQIIQESKQESSDSEATKPQMLQVDQQFHKGKITGDIHLALKKLENARNFFEEAGIKFGVAKCCLVEAEFILNLFLDTVTEFGEDIEKTELDLFNRVEQAIILFGELKFEGLSANAYKLRGILCERKYQEVIEQEQNDIKSPHPMSTPGGMNSSKKNKISMFDPVEYLIEAKEAYEKSIEKYSLIREQNQIVSVNIKLETLIEKLQKKSSNMLIFAKAAPLVENCQEQFGRNSIFAQNVLPFQQNSDIKSVGVSTRYSTRFRKNVAQEAQKSGQQINVKFDQLNKEILDYVKDHGCKLLHLCSQVFDEYRLCLEDKNGVADYLTIDNLTKSLLPDNPHHQNQKHHHNHNHACSLKVQLVVLAVPLSTQIAQAFVTMGVPHVVSFGYESFVKHPILIPAIQNLISNFCFSFYKKLFANTINVKQAFEQTVNECFETDFGDIIEKLWQIERIEGLVLSHYDDLIQQGPKLHPLESRTHEKLLFTSLSEEQKKKGDQFIDSSKKRTLTNHMGYMRFSFTGRRPQIFELVQNLTAKQRLINICGPQGLGKTAFVLQTAHFLAFRNLFTDGIVYSDMKDVSTTQEFKDRLKESMMQTRLIDEKDDLGNQLKKDNSLHIFDNVESIINNKGEFDWSIVNLLTVYENMRIIVISRNELKLDNVDLLLIKYLPPLTDEEAVDLIQSNCERQIMEDLLEEQQQQNLENFDMESVGERRSQRRGSNRPRKQVKKINIYEYMRNDKNFQQCGGFPDLLLLLAKELSSKNLSDIKLIKALGIENQKRVEDIGIYKHTINQKAKVLKQQEMQTFGPFEQAVAPDNNDGGESPSFVQFNNNTSMSQVAFQQEDDLFTRLQNNSQWVEDFNDSKRRGSIPFQPKGFGSSSHSSNVNLLHRQQTSRFAEEEEKKEDKQIQRRGTVVFGQNNGGGGVPPSQLTEALQAVPSWNNYIPQSAEEEENQLKIALLQSQQDKYHKFKRAPTLGSLFDGSQDLSSPLNQSPMQSPALSRVNSTNQPQQQVTKQSSQSYKKRPYTKVQTGSNSSQQKQGPPKKGMKDSDDNNM